MFQSYLNRMREFNDMMGPSSWETLFASEEEIEKAKMGNSAWEKKLVRASVHPDSGEVIPLPFRMAAHVPMNGAIVTGMLLAKSPFSQAVAQVVNATFNACQFYANRNRSNYVSNMQLGVSLSLSVITSVGVSVWLAKRGKGGIWLPFLAAAAAKPLQVSTMRLDELTKGVVVYGEEEGRRKVELRGEDGEIVRSKVAGIAAVSSTIATRILYLAPPMLLPALLIPTLPLTPLTLPHTLASVIITAACSAVTTPTCLALFDQSFSIPTTIAEPHIQQVAANHNLKHLHFNRGL